MRVGIDIRKYYDFGIGTYIQNLVSIFDQKTDIDLTCFLSDIDKRTIGKSLKGLIITDNSAKYSFKELFSLSANANKQNLDIFHSPHYTLPLNLKMPSVVTIHDIIHFRLKEYFSLPKRIYAYSIIRHACTASNVIIVDSEFGKKELVEVFKINERKIRVIPLGVNQLYFQRIDEDSKEEFRRKYKITKRYILYTGSLKPHKNIPILLKAYKKVLEKHDVQLVFAGENIFEQSSLVKYIDENNLSKTIINLGRISQTELTSAYQSSSMVVLPSFYEGFGFSMVEAMASGVPAIGARSTSITEVVGDAGILFDPNDEDDLSQQILSILKNDALRSSLIQKGNERARSFTWEQCADQTLQIYKEVVQ